MKKSLLAIIIVVFTGTYFFLVKRNVIDTTKVLPPIRVLNAYPDVILKLTFSPDGKILAFAGQNNDSFIQIKLLNTANWKEIKYPKTSDLARSESNAEGSDFKVATFSPDSKWIAISHSADILADLKSNKKSDDESTETIDIRKVGTWNKIHQIKIKGPDEYDIGTMQLSYSPDGKYFVQIDSYNLRIWQTKDWKLLHTLNFKSSTVEHSYHKRIDAFSISPDSKIIATVTSKYDVKLWNIETGLPLDERKQPTGISPLSKDSYGYTKIQFSPDGTKLAIITGDNVSSTLYLWSIGQGKMLYKIKDSEGGMHGLSFSPDGKYIATSSFAPQVILWNAVSGEEVKVLDRGGNFPYNDVQYSPDGKILLACVEGQIKIWQMN